MNESHLMKGRTQKISDNLETWPQKNRTASEGYVGGRTFGGMTENHLKEPIYQKVRCSKLKEPPCTERYARWCERTAGELIPCFLLDLPTICQQGVVEELVVI